MRLAAITALVLFAAPAAAHAEPWPPMQWLAERCYRLGVEAHARGEYRTALAMFQLADGLAPHPLMAYNQGQALRLAGDADGALVAYQRFLATAPTGPEAEAARRWVDELSRRPPPTPPTAPPVEVRPPPPPPEMRVVDRGAGVRVAGLVTAGLGAATLGVGVYYGLEARSASDALSTPGATFDPDLDAHGRRADRRFQIGVIAGGALVVAGAGLYLYGRGRHQRVVFTPTGDGAAVAIAGVLP